MAARPLEHFDVAVLGGGAAGIAAAISAARLKKSCVILDRMPRIGRKILASGNGRCNLLNDNLSETYYNPEARPLVKSIFDKFSKEQISDFFRKLGLITYSDSGRIFPVTNQAASVLTILESEVKRLGIQVELDFSANHVDFSNDNFTVHSKPGRKVSAKTLIIAGGGRSYPALGSDGSVYKIAQGFGHRLIEPVPTAVPLVVKSDLCQSLQGQKIDAAVTSIIDGKPAAHASGELLFAKYGLSGTAILDVSREISVALNRHRKTGVKLTADLVPFMEMDELVSEFDRRIKSGKSAGELLVGILPNKFGPALAPLLKTMEARTIASALKSKEFAVSGTRGWNEADFTAGGIDTHEVTAGTLESKLKKNLYFAGEILDVDGCRGGYNLAWAWASGFVAGMA